MKNIIGLIGLVFIILAINSCDNTKEKDFSKEGTIDIDSLLVIYPDSVDLLVKRGNVNYVQYNYVEALADAAKAFRLDSNNLEARLLYSDLLNNLEDRTVNDVSVAQRHYKVIVNKQPKNTRALVGLASTFLFQQDFNSTFQYINEALRIDPKYRNAYVLKGTAYLALDDKKLAISSYETAIQQDPDFYEAYFLLGQIYQQENNPVCVDYFVSAQKLNPENLEFKYQVAYSKQTFGKLEGAKAMYREMAADTVDVYVMRALFHQGYIKQFMEDDIDSAMYFYKSAIESEPRFVEAWFNLGVCHEEKGNTTQALNSYSNCLKYNPDFETARIRANKLKQ